VRAAFALEQASVLHQPPKQRASVHSTFTVSRIASGRTPRTLASRRSSNIRAMASARRARHASTVRPWPLAPGISGQEPMYQSPSRSLTALMSFLMICFPNTECNHLGQTATLNLTSS
jgi:hypothetical protein